MGIYSRIVSLGLFCVVALIAVVAVAFYYPDVQVLMAAAAVAGVIIVMADGDGKTGLGIT